MKRFLRWFLDLLDRKFPDKVVVTEASYAALQGRIAALESDAAALSERVKKLDMNVQIHNQAMGFSQKPGGMLER